MIIQYGPAVRDTLKKVDVRIRKSFKERIHLFEKNQLDPQLNNHQLREPYKGLRSIDITNDYRAIFEEIHEGEDTVMYFSILGTHNELYGQKSVS